MILEKRLLVYLSRFMFKLNKNLGQDSIGDSNRDDLLRLSSIKELIKKHLIFLDNWPQPISFEYYNQVS